MASQQQSNLIVIDADKSTSIKQNQKKQLNTINTIVIDDDKSKRKYQSAESSSDESSSSDDNSDLIKYIHTNDMPKSLRESLRVSY